jgi:chlorophyllase
MAASTTMNPSSIADQVLEPAVATTTSVFNPRKLAVEVLPVDHRNNALLTHPVPVLIAAPRVPGTYPVAMLLHGFFLRDNFYQQLLKHVASFGFIMVAPQVVTHCMHFLQLIRFFVPKEQEKMTRTLTI